MLAESTGLSTVIKQFNLLAQILNHRAVGLFEATGGDDRTVRLWARTGQALLVLYPGITPPEVVAFSPDGVFLAAGFYKASVVYQLARRLGRRMPGHGFWTPSLAFHPRKPVLASTSRDNDVTLWDVSTGQELKRFPGFPGLVGNLSFSPDGRLLAAAPFARFTPLFRGSTFLMSDTVTLVEADTGRPRRHFKGAYTAAVAFDPAGQRLALGERDGAVSVRDVACGEVGCH